MSEESLSAMPSAFFSNTLLHCSGSVAHAPSSSNAHAAPVKTSIGAVTAIAAVMMVREALSMATSPTIVECTVIRANGYHRGQQVRRLVAAFEAPGLAF